MKKPNACLGEPKGLNIRQPRAKPWGLEPKFEQALKGRYNSWVLLCL